MSKTWKILEALFKEAKQYRGDTGLAFKDIDALMQGNEHRPGITGRPANPEGEVVDANYKFDPAIWGKWYPSQDPALTMASTDKDVVGQYAGRSQGGMTFKTTWGQRVVNVPGKARGDFERLPSAMDRYDILMQGEVGIGPKGRPVGLLQRVAYAPSIGSSEERRARLTAMMSGKDPGPLNRRPQPHRPEPGKEHQPGPPLPSDDPHSRGFGDRPDTPSAGLRTGQGSKAAKGTYKRSSWYVPGRGIGKGERED